MIHLSEKDPERLSQWLRRADELRDLPETTLHWLIGRGEYRLFPAGSYLFERGEPVAHLSIVLEGRVSVQFEQNGQRRELMQLEGGQLTGLLPYSRMTHAQGYGLALADTWVLALHKAHFREIPGVDEQLMQNLISAMTARVREFTQTRTQDEKLMALGKLSAGLAHELNNPAAAMVRNADALRRLVHKSPEKFKAVTAVRLSAEQIDGINTILFRHIEGDLQCRLSSIGRSEAEDELCDWLEARGIRAAEDMAYTFVDNNVRLEDLEAIEGIVAGQHLGEVLWWVESTLSIEKLVLEMRQLAARIEALVGAVKGYSHMDRGGERERSDLHEGLRATLTMLGHKLRQKQIRVRDEFDEGLPPIPLFPGQANQMWTNLIDNAIDAMPQGGELHLRTRQADGKVEIHIEDNGAGIPEDILSQIFDPFFTTKPMGQGTGLGLDIVQKIVKRHDGSIRVRSKPGQTIFTVCLPTAG